MQLFERISATMHIGFDLRAWLALSVFLVFPLLMVTSPAVLVTDMPMDIYVPLDGAWRVHEGQTPHVDFSTPVGLLYYETYGAAMDLFGPTARVLLFVPAFFSVVMLGVVALATRSRLPDAVRVLFAVYLAFVVLSPMHLDNSTLVHLASYNRIGWALVSAVVLLVALPPRDRSVGWEVAEAGVAIAILWILFFLKITYFGLGGLALLLAVVFVPENRRIALSAGVLTWVGIGVAFGVSDIPALYVGDIKSALDSADPKWAEFNAARTPGFPKLMKDVSANLPMLVLSLLALPLADRFKKGGEDLQKSRLFAVSLLLLVVLGTLQSHDHHAPALVGVVAVGIAAAVRMDLPKLALGLTLATSLILGRHMSRDVSAVIMHRLLSGNTERTIAATGIAGSPVADVRYLVAGGEDAKPALRFVASGEISAEVYRELGLTFDGADLRLMLDEGAALIRAHSPVQPRVFSFMFAAPYPYLLGGPPPVNTLSWYHPSRTFGGKNPLDPAVQFSDVDIVLVPMALRTPPIRAMLEDLQPALDEEWRVVDETPLWTVYLRR